MMFVGLDVSLEYIPGNLVFGFRGLITPVMGGSTIVCHLPLCWMIII